MRLTTKARSNRCGVYFTLKIIISNGSTVDQFHLGFSRCHMGRRQESMDGRVADGLSDHHASVHGVHGPSDAVAAEPRVWPVPVLVQALRACGGQARCDDWAADQAVVQGAARLQSCGGGIDVGGGASK